MSIWICTIAVLSLIVFISVVPGMWIQSEDRPPPPQLAGGAYPLIAVLAAMPAYKPCFLSSNPTFYLG